MAELKTRETDESVLKFLDTIEDVTKRNDCYTIAEMMEKVSGFKPKMWGAAIVGFGTYHYKYESGHEGDACLIGFSPRKQNISLHIMNAVNQKPGLLAKLGKYKTGKGCLYINKVSDIDIKILKQLVTFSFDSVTHKVGN